MALFAGRRHTQTEHAGAKNGGGQRCDRETAKHTSNKFRRENDRRAAREGLDQ